MAKPYVSIHGSRLGLSGNGLLRVDGKDFKGDIPGLGTDYFLHSGTGNDNSDGKTPDRAVATLDVAIGLTTANQGDRIIGLPNHAETITGVGGITADIAGISFIGLGTGNQRPRFLMDGAATVTFVASADDFYIENCVFAAGHADIVRCFNVTGAFFWAHNVELVENVATENFLIPFDFTGSTDADCDGAKVTSCRSIGLDASATEFIAIVADIDGLQVLDNFVVQSGSTDGALVKVATAKSLQNLAIIGNYLQHAMTTGDLLIDNGQADNTGIVAHNRCIHKDVAAAILIDCDGAGVFDNLSTADVTLSGFILPAIDTDT